MLLSVFNPVLGGMELEEALGYLKSVGVEAMELGCGGYPGTRHASAIEMAKNPNELLRIKGLFEKYGIKIAALSVHGNGVHPIKELAEKGSEEFYSACAIANKLGTDRVVTFSGCPGDGTSKQPNWVTCSWPNEYQEVLAYQWNEVLIPYWKKQNKIATDANVKVAIEMHPGFCVYNAETMLRLNKAAGSAIGANLDPSHLLWQGCDIVQVIHALKDIIYFVHAKDTMFNTAKRDVKGVLDTAPYTSEMDRSWLFRTVGYGVAKWHDIISALRMNGYDYAISIEHEDSLMTSKEGLEKAVEYLKRVLIKDGSGTDAWWA